MQKWKWVVELSDEQRRELRSLVRKGRASARRITRARVLLLAAEDRPDVEVGAVLDTSRSTVKRIRRRFVEHGLEAALSKRPRPGAAPKLDERGQATLIALACSNPPEGRTSWTMQLLADELVVRRVVSVTLGDDILGCTAIAELSERRANFAHRVLESCRRT